MPEFVREVCWQPAVVQATVATEAVHPSASVFVATHSPLRIQRRLNVGAGVNTTLVSEAELVAEFLEAPTNAGVLVAPVIGESGSGKSHLVRWAAANINESAQRRVIYLPKAKTNLAAVVRALLRDHKGTLSGDLLRALDRLGDDITEDTLQRRILDELAEAVHTADGRSMHEKWLVGRNRLSALLHDPYLRDHLLTAGSLVPRKAAHAISGRGRDEDDIPLEFTIDDLPLTLTGVQANAAKETRDVFGRLVAQPHMQIAAVALLNRYIDVAVMQATNLGVGRVQQAFLEIREQLADVDQEIVLLIEDFALIQGVQRDLLDAIVESSATVNGRKRAPIRTLMAVTSGFYRELPATFRTRAEASSPIYELDLAMSGADAFPDEQIIDFVGRYLNAARLGQSRIDAANVAAGGAVPNFCQDCPLRDPCHGSFGCSQQGYGLYPYNASALLRAVKASAPDDHPQDFNPRSVLARVVRQGLTEAARPIRDGDYPDEGFAALFPPRPGMSRLDLPARDTLAQTDPALAQRRQLLLEFWGGAPSDLINLNPAIHRAFAIPELSEAVISARPVSQPPRTTGTAVSTTAVPPGAESAALRGRLETITKWVNREQDLPQTLANEIRGIIQSAVIQHIEWSDPVTKQRAAGQVSKTFPANARTVSIQHARGQNLAIGVTAPIEFECNAANGVFFQQLLRARDGIVPETVVARARLDRLARQYAPTALQAFISHQELDQAHLQATVRMLLIGALICGGPNDLGSPPGRIAATLWDGSSRKRGDAPWRVSRWVDFESEHRTARVAVVKALTEAIGTSQGTGAVQAIDPERLNTLTEAAIRTDPQDLMRSQLPEWAIPAWTPLERLMHLVGDQLEYLRAQVAGIRRLVPTGIGFQETVTAATSAAKAGQVRGLVPADLPEVAAANTRAAGFDFRTVNALETALSRVTPGVDQWTRYEVVGRDCGSDPAAIAAYLTATEKWVDAGLARAASQHPAAASDLDQDIAAALATWERLSEEAR